MELESDILDINIVNRILELYKVTIFYSL